MGARNYAIPDGWAYTNVGRSEISVSPAALILPWGSESQVTRCLLVTQAAEVGGLTITSLFNQTP